MTLERENDLAGARKDRDLTQRCRVCLGWEHWNDKVRSLDPASAPSTFSFSPSLQWLHNPNVNYPFQAGTQRLLPQTIQCGRMVKRPWKSIKGGGRA